MTELRVFLSIVSAIVLFWYGLEAFSQQIQTVGKGALQDWLRRFTEKRWLGMLTGAAAVMIVQSSGAVTSLAAALVDAGAISFRSSLGVLLGANIGTTSTGLLVSLDLEWIGPFFIVLGAALSALPMRLKLVGKAAFYFGFVLFSLDVLNLALEPLAQNAVFEQLISLSSEPLTGALTGMLVTTVVQSGSIITGLSILLVQQGLLTGTAAIPIAVGANLGAAAMPLLTTSRMRRSARGVALANLGFNMLGVALFIPFLEPFARLMVGSIADPGMAVALAQLAFNIVMSLAALVVMRFFGSRISAVCAGEPSS